MFGKKQKGANYMAQDIRVFKSKRDIETAVIQLILEEDFSKLTI